MWVTCAIIELGNKYGCVCEAILQTCSSECNQTHNLPVFVVDYLGFPPIRYGDSYMYQSHLGGEDPAAA